MRCWEARKSKPNPTQPNLTQPNPTEPNPTQPNPTHPNPTQSKTNKIVFLSIWTFLCASQNEEKYCILGDPNVGWDTQHTSKTGHTTW